ncbi:MAG: hypothetical protein GY754_35400 [bacterium]|nr:hypothetical protein [bacterium]
MNTEIYYFSGTGNSLAVAKDIAGKINGKLISIPSTIDLESISSDAEIIGIVFPVYHATFGESGIPNIVQRFIGKLNNIDSKYLFAVCTHSGMPGFTIENTSHFISKQGGELSAGITVKMNIPYSAFEKIKYSLFKKELAINIHKDKEKREKLFDQWEKKLQYIEDCLIKRKKVKLDSPGKIYRKLITSFFLFQKRAAKYRYQKLSGSTADSFRKLTMLADKSFKINSKCNGCGICQKICPVRNIEIVEDKPVWLHKCENCYACFQWCPQEAISGDIVEYEKKYHHPGAALSDLIDK